MTFKKTHVSCCGITILSTTCPRFSVGVILRESSAAAVSRLIYTATCLVSHDLRRLYTSEPLVVFMNVFRGKLCPIRFGSAFAVERSKTGMIYAMI